jgi:hypothetical protein
VLATKWPQIPGIRAKAVSSLEVQRCQTTSFNDRPFANEHKYEHTGSPFTMSQVRGSRFHDSPHHQDSDRAKLNGGPQVGFCGLMWIFNLSLTQMHNTSALSDNAQTNSPDSLSMKEMRFIVETGCQAPSTSRVPWEQHQATHQSQLSSSLSRSWS